MKHDKKAINRKNLLNYWPCLILILLAVPFFVRAFYGFDWSDECYYLALPYRFALGDHLFVDSWDIHQTSAILVAPIMWLYHRIVGNMDAILLFMRLLFVLFQLIISLIVYHMVHKLYENRTVGLLTAAVCLAFVPFSISDFSYNTISYLLIILTGMLLAGLYFAETSAKMTVLSALAGIVYVCACLAYPYYVLVFPSYMVLLCAVRPRVKTPDGDRKTLRPLVFFLAGCLFAGAVIVIYVLATVGFSGVRDNIFNLFYDPEHPQFKVLAKLTEFLKDYYNQLFLAMLQFFLLVVVYLCNHMKINIGINFIFEFLIRFIMPFCILINIILVLAAPKTVPLTTKINQIQICAGFWPLILYASRPSKRQAVMLLTMYIPANLMCVGVYFASNNGMKGASYVLVLAVMSVCPIAYEYYYPAFQKLKEANKKRIALLIRAGLVAMTVCVIMLNGALRFYTVYRDKPVNQLTVQMTNGPAKGIYTTPASAADYNAIVQDIRASLPDEGRVMFPGLLPFGYLCTNQRPAPHSLWRTPLSSTRLAEYFGLQPENRPVFIYMVKKQYGLTNDKNEPDIGLAQRIAGKTVTEKETKYSYQYTVGK